MSEPQQSSGDSQRAKQLPTGFEQSRSVYESLVNTLPLNLLIKDTQGRRLFANQTYLLNRGIALEDLIGKRDQDLFPAEIAKQYIEDDQEVIRTGVAMHSIEESVSPAGERRWIERFKSPIFDPQNRIIGLQLLFWDVTDKVQAEEHLKHERDLLNSLMRHIPDSIYFKDSESRFLRISDAMAEKFGLSNADDALGKTDADIFSGEHAQRARDDELQVMKSREPLVDRIEKETWPDREDSWCMSTKMPFLNSEGNVAGTFGITRDITELKKYQDQLREARDAADRANRAKSDFLANMSHEIRTPMNAIIGMSELLSQTRLSEEQQDYVQLVRDSSDSLLQLLNDILDFSKIEARKLELESIPFSLRDLVEKTGRSLSVRAAEKNLELACRVAPDVPDRWIGDPGRLRQIMINLIGNAIKFTDEGEVLVDVALDETVLDETVLEETESSATEMESPDGKRSLRFSVQDTGIGIPQEKLDDVLEAFTQADASTTRRFGGTGLGLAISRQLVELMHGELELESQLGHGTKFQFSIRFEQAPSSGEDPKKQLKKLGHLPVLVVDDNPTNRRILKEIFTAWRFHPTLAEDGRTALEQIDDAGKRGAPFSLAVLDCMMPEMDGFELARRIREHYTREQTKLIILSSASRSGDVERCRDIGISRYLTKPVVQSELLDTILQVMGMESDVKPPSEEELPACPPLRVLVAEDGIANQHVAVGMLQAAGHHAVVAADGRETIVRWHNDPFDVILMDMHMPVMDGIEATEHIRAAEEATGKHIPIIALTAAAMKADAEACSKAGMDAYLTKPIHPRMLQEMLAKFAPSRPTLAEDNSHQQPCQDPSQDTPSSGSSGSGQRLAEKLAWRAPHATEDTIDLRSAAGRVPGGLSGVRRLAEVFLPECDSLMATLRAEIPGGDAALIQRTAHTLKGSANLFFAKSVNEAALKIEQKAAAKQIDSLSIEMKSLEEEVELMVRALMNFIDLCSEPSPGTKESES